MGTEPTPTFPSPRLISSCQLSFRMKSTEVFPPSVTAIINGNHVSVSHETVSV